MEINIFLKYENKLIEYEIKLKIFKMIQFKAGACQKEQKSVARYSLHLRVPKSHVHPLYGIHYIEIHYTESSPDWAPFI